MAVMTSAPGHFAIPTAPAVGVTVAQSASANTFGSYVQMIASTASALYITGISATVTQGATPSTYIALDIGVGAGGSEVLQDQQVAGTGAAASVPFAIFIPIYPYVPVANAQRIAVKTASDVASALSWKITLMCIAQSNVVDDGVAESSNVKQWNGTNVSSPATAGIPDVNIKNINNVAAATPGASGGMLIAGSNTGPVTVTGGLVLNGTAASGATPATAGLTLTGGAASTTGGGVAAAGITSTGGAGAASTNGAAPGGTFAGGGTNTVASIASGLKVSGTSSGHGLDLESGTTGSANALNATSNAPSGNGIIGTGGSGGAGMFAQGGGSGNGFQAQAVTNNGGAGMALFGANAGAAVAAGPGLLLNGGNASTTAGKTAGQGLQSVGGLGAASNNGAGAGALFQGGGNNTVASNAHGLQVLGTSTGSGLSAGSGSGATGDGATFTSNATAGNGITATHSGSGVFDFNATTTPLVLAKTTNITGFNDITAAAAATTIWTDLMASSDFSTANSIGALLKADINAPIGSIPTNPLTTLGATAPSNWIDTGQITTAACNMLADFHHRRHQANIETSTFGDSLAVGSLYGMIQMSQAADTTTTAASITIFKTDLATHLGTIAIIASAGANPITQVGA